MNSFRFAGLITVIAAGALASAQYTAIDCNPSTGYLGSTFRGYGNGSLVGNIFADDINSTQHWAVFSDPFTFSLLDDPSISYNQFINATDGTQHVGQGALADFNTHAFLWNGLNLPGIDLHPGAPYTISAANAVDSGRQVGYVYEQPFNSQQIERAALWFGSAGSMVLLTPDAPGGEARGVRGNQQVGLFWEIGFAAVHIPRACIWNDTAASMVSLSPGDDYSTVANATDGVQQGGYSQGPADPYYHAAVWHGTASSFVDLHPAGNFAYSYVAAVENGRQAGWVTTTSGGFETGISHAAIWSGTKASFLDLHQFLPPEALSSVATGIDADGNVYGYADVQQGFYVIPHAFKWTFAPPPPAYTIPNFLAPMNDPATPESSFKKNSTITVKFQLLDGTGTPVNGGAATISLVQLGSTNVPVNESSFITPADTGSLFTYNATTNTYIYHLGTKNLLANTRYQVTATVGGVTHSVTFSLR